MLKLAADHVRIKLLSSPPERRLILWSRVGRQEARPEGLSPVPQQIWVPRCEPYYSGITSASCAGLWGGIWTHNSKPKGNLEWHVGDQVLDSPQHWGIVLLKHFPFMVSWAWQPQPLSFLVHRQDESEGQRRGNSRKAYGAWIRCGTVKASGPDA